MSTKKPTPKRPARPPTDWAAVLRTGPAGVKKWNALTVAGRKAVKLANVDLTGCDLTGINLLSLSIPGLKAAGAALAGARLANGTFLKADFANANLEGATLQGTILKDADFTGARLTGAKLTAAVLYSAKLAGADLTRANLANAELTGTDLTGAVLAETDVTGATFDKNTKWPADPIPGEMRWVGQATDPRLAGRGKRAAAVDINGLMARLHKVIDEGRMKRTLDMLKAGKNQLFAEVEPTLVRGIVKSQTRADKVYSCVLTADGTYSCCTLDLGQCMGLDREPCKHILVLLIGLARAGQLDPTTADKWAVAAAAKNPRWNKTVQNHMSDTILKYKGAQAGEIDWRPTETIPEDFYAM